MAIDLQKLEQKFNALLDDPNFVTYFEQWLEARNVSQNSSKPIVSSSADKPLTECMVGRDTECNHPKCPVTDEDAANGRYCTLPLYDWRT
jgi:predicted phosphoadenosine phosphosulfate sulfurtransferase